MALAMIWLWWAIARNYAPVPTIPTKNLENLVFELNYLEGLGTRAESMLNDVIQFNVHVRKGLEDYEIFVVDEVDQICLHVQNRAGGKVYTLCDRERIAADMVARFAHAISPMFILIYLAETHDLLQLEQLHGRPKQSLAAPSALSKRSAAAQRKHWHSSSALRPRRSSRLAENVRQPKPDAEHEELISGVKGSAAVASYFRTRPVYTVTRCCCAAAKDCPDRDGLFAERVSGRGSPYVRIVPE
ncbi:hypothetical protein BJX66DRAFT_345966 [Aspergillus keveii]|uniref:Uncharacterized protein n=1 Tax=Aspergillus keveii TaxID=714993 RepID=A0ABR4FGF7_9EURO